MWPHCQKQSSVLPYTGMKFCFSIIYSHQKRLSFNFTVCATLPLLLASLSMLYTCITTPKFLHYFYTDTHKKCLNIQNIAWSGGISLGPEQILSGITIHLNRDFSLSSYNVQLSGFCKSWQFALTFFIFVPLLSHCSHHTHHEEEHDEDDHHQSPHHTNKHSSRY